jgi:hypothetical protein
MPRTDLWPTSATRVEIDQRSREARLRLEHLERLLTLRVPGGSWLRLVPYWSGPRFFGGGRMQSRSTKVAPTSGRRRQSRAFPIEVCIGGVVRRPSAA